MRFEKTKFAVAAALFALWSVYLLPFDAKADTAIVVAACGTPPTTYTAGQNRPTTMDVNGVLCAAGSGTVGSPTVVQGPAADDAAASGNPVPIGARFETTADAVDTGDIGYLAMGSRRALHVQLMGANSTSSVSVGTLDTDDILGSSINGLQVRSLPYYFDGTTTQLDRARSVVNTTDSTGTGIAAAGLVAQCAPAASVTTVQFGNVALNCATHAIMAERDGDLFLNIVLAAPTTTVVKSGAGRFHKLCINKPTATGVITIYDNTAASGTLIGTITQPAALLSSGPICIPYDLSFGTGLTVVTATAAQDVTVTYR